MYKRTKFVGLLIALFSGVLFMAIVAKLGSIKKTSSVPKILLCGFEPFGPHSNNTSWEAISVYCADVRTKYIESVKLPVSYRKASVVLLEKIEETQPDIVVAFAMGRDSVVLQRVAINFDDAPWPDNDGERRQNEPIKRNGPVGFWSTLPLIEIQDMLSRQQLSSEISNFCGNYLSNHIFYELMCLTEKNRKVKMAGLVHLPRYEYGFSKYDLAKVVGIVIDTCISRLGKENSFPPQ